MADVYERRTLAEAARQSGRELAQRQYNQARNAELELFRAKVAAAKERVSAAEAPIEFIPEGYQPGTSKEIDAALAELAAARKALDALDGAQPDGRDLANQMQAAVDAADAEFNRQLAAGFPEA